jgi:shikimate kinase
VNVVLIGFMGVGKTTVGRLLATRLRFRFVDSDAEAEKEMGMRISKAYTLLGEPEFRATERRMVKRLSESEGQVIALGGGAILDSANVEALQRVGRMVLLTASPEEINVRTRRGHSRPLLLGGDRLTRIKALIEERREKYLAAADIVVDTNGLSPIRVAEAIQNKLEAAAI